MAEDHTIPDEHVLPCDFVINHLRFRKGVKLETVRQAALRWNSVCIDHFADKRAKTAAAQLPIVS